MVDAPERIWLPPGAEVFDTTKPNAVATIEFVRADIAAIQLAEANERWDHFQKLASDHRDELERELAEAREHGHDSFKLACMWQDQAKEARARAEVSEKALREARRGLNMVHDGLMDSTRPRQSVGEVAAYWLERTDAALAALTTEGRKNG